jgi:YVTN family beta-propeller protein
VVATIAVGKFPIDMAVSPSGAHVYVANSDGTVSIIDAATNTVIASPAIQGADFLGGIAVRPDGTAAYVTGGTGSTLSFIQAATNTVSATIPFGNSPGRIAFNPGPNEFYIANENSGILSILDTSNTALLTDFQIPLANAGPADLAISPDSQRLYVVNNFSNILTIINAASRSFVKTLNLDRPTSVVLSHDGARVYVAHQLLNTQPSHTVSVLDTATYAVLDLLTVGNGPMGMAVSPDGSRLYVTNSDDNTLSVVATADLGVIATVPVGTVPSCVAVSPDGTRLYVANKFDFTVSVLDAASVAGGG